VLHEGDRLLAQDHAVLSIAVEGRASRFAPLCASGIYFAKFYVVLARLAR
jgi:hypothetical protein